METHNHSHSHPHPFTHEHHPLSHDHSHEHENVTNWVDAILGGSRAVPLFSKPVLSPPTNGTSNVMRGSIQYHEHSLGAKQMSEIFGCKVEELPDGMGWQTETLTLNTHEATHIDAPVHYKPKLLNGSPSPGIDAFPVQHFIGHAVVLDLRSFANGTIIEVAEAERLLDQMEYNLRPRDIVLLLTGADKYLGRPDYLDYGVGISAEVVRWLREKDINVIGTDAFTIDEPFTQMARRYAQTKDSSVIWPAHYASDTLLHYEKLTNLAQLPPIGSLFVGPPMPLTDASAGPANPVGFVPHGLEPISGTEN